MSVEEWRDLLIGADASGKVAECRSDRDETKQTKKMQFAFYIAQDNVLLVFCLLALDAY